jgi:2,4-dienoyl-CoA reductase-like NADH-dependent reductase (Old Yellow Enzyme family)/thioredoxin reductase
VHVPTDISSASPDGGTNERVIRYHEEIAKGGCGFVIVGATTPDSATGRPTVTCLCADADYYIPGLHMLSAAMQKHGAKCAVQIQHPGRQAAYPRYGQISCSDIISDQPGSAGHEVIYAGDKAHGKIAREMAVEEVYDLIEKFAEAAWRVKEAGFDAVELHAAHGYMIAQFLSPATNTRNDRFGGRFENRMRFILEIIDRIKMKCGEDFPILVRYSGEEWREDGRKLEESVRIATELEKAGVAALDISAGIFDVAEAVMDPMYYQEGWNTYAAEAVKKAVSIPVITSHTLRSPEYCEQIIAEGKTDMVGMSRQLVADPYWGNKAKAGRPEEIRKCISCLIGCWSESLMIKHEMRCAINPAMGDVRFLDMKPAGKSLKVGIAGGGIAGMEAARIAALRGHDVTIFEKENELGGALRMCCMVPPKDKMKWYMDWLRRQVTKLGVKVLLKTEAGPETLKNFDVVLCATGAKTATPQIPGAEKGVKFEDLLVCGKINCEYWPAEGKRKPSFAGQKVLVYGNHYGATDTAEMLAMRGKEVVYVTQDREFAPNIEAVHREVMKKRFAGGNGGGLPGRPIKIPVDIRLETTLLEIKDKSAVLMDSKFRRYELACDTVVFGETKPDDALFEQMQASGALVANIGDSRKVRNVRGAMTDGANAAYMLDEGLFMNANNTLSAALPMDVEKMVR